LSQGMERLGSRFSAEVGAVLALEVCRLVKQWLPVAVQAPENVEARAQMLHAAMLSGCVIAQSRTTLVHSLGYYYTLEFGIAHGLANALLLAPVFRYNARHAPDKVAAIAAALGGECPATPDAAAAAITRAIHALLGELGVSPAAEDAGVRTDRLPEFAAQIYQDRSRFTTQPGDPNEEDVRQFFLDSAVGA
ncbi:MAG: iron-containing alcohol dehydrogenase, partial [Candidatus Hydrogenedentes bacterium]|nr:iron-containing alcohol dehydrogenase [Candidatus Hydrogenedentota bacterium]